MRCFQYIVSIFSELSLCFLYQKNSQRSNLKISNTFVYFWHFFRCVKDKGMGSEYQAMSPSDKSIVQELIFLK